MTPDEKVRAIEARITACMRGQSDTILCPYCGVLNSADREQLCCHDMAFVVRAVLRKQAQAAILDTAKRVGDRMAEASSRN